MHKLAKRQVIIVYIPTEPWGSRQDKALSLDLVGVVWLAVGSSGCALAMGLSAGAVGTSGRPTLTPCFADAIPWN